MRFDARERSDGGDELKEADRLRLEVVELFTPIRRQREHSRELC